MKDFKGKVAVITGAGRGVGRAMAFRCAKEGMKIVLAGIGLESLSKTNADLKAIGAETLVVQTDVAIESDVENLADKAYEQFGEVHLLFNNAGVGLREDSILNATVDDWRWVMDVNVNGVFYGVRAFIPRMIEMGTDAHVINNASLAGFVPAFAIDGGIYSVSKHAVVAITEALYGELAGVAPNIKVTVYAPGYMVSDWDTSDRSRHARYANTASKPLTPEELAEQQEERANNAMPAEQAIDILMDAVKDDLLYVGVKAFTDIHPDVPDIIRQRAQNMLDESNPNL